MLDFAEFYNEEAELMFGRNIMPDPDLKYISPKDWDEYNYQVGIHQNIRNRTGLSFIPRSSLRNDLSFEGILLRKLCEEAKSITYEKGTLLNLVRELNNIIPTRTNDKYPAEKGGYVFFIPDDNLPKVEFFELESNGDSRSYSPINPYFRPPRGKGALAIIHTHPEEALFWRKAGNRAIFDTQYSRSDGDGYTKVPLYSIGYTEVDYYSPKGKRYSKNGLCSNDDLLHGRFNILKHALREYANR